jgi:hypothetical protein
MLRRKAREGPELREAFNREFWEFWEMFSRVLVSGLPHRRDNPKVLLPDLPELPVLNPPGSPHPP